MKVFISRKGAIREAIRVAREEGYSDKRIMQDVRVYPKFVRGEHTGYTVTVPEYTGRRTI